MNPGMHVRLISDPGRRGITTDKSRTTGGRTKWQIAFFDGQPGFFTENQLEVIPHVEHPLDLFGQGKFGRARDLRGAITNIRLSGRLADLIYSMETTNTDFYPYQFKPVLNFLDSPGRGILIADEVGLGKTIEAGLIWTELRSRYDARRLMVLCPAMLREKWRFELKKRFGISAKIVSATEAHQTLEEFSDGELNEFAIIASMQGLRPDNAWNDDENPSQSSSAMLARFLEGHAHNGALFDLLIVDEAHYLRNPHSMTSKLGRLLRDVSDHVVLLSATPIHLGNKDLYHLLNLVDEDSFNQIHVFDDILQANAPLIKARDMILNGSVDAEAFLEELKKARNHILLSTNRQLQAILDFPPNENDLSDSAYRSELSYQLDGINLLGRAVTRTRKREVTEWRVLREAVPEMVDLTVAEMEFYERVTSLVRKYCFERDVNEGFLLATPQRQISSSMPAALREWQARKDNLCEYYKNLIYEDMGQDVERPQEIGPLVWAILENIDELGDLQELWENDSKYSRLIGMLNGHFKTHQNDKILIFAYFRPTLRYLQERLMSDGIDSLIILGGEAVDRYEVMDKFKSLDGPNILLASEVLSEGVDLQFSHILINYDLPWNPMKVEQRIGRIDRLGQTSPRILIWNLFYADTIDARIYKRLYERLGVFEYALGGLEAVLGEEIKKLTTDLMIGNLTKNQEDERITQTEQAISNLREQEERLESDANNLIAHGDYILHQVRAAKLLGRWITGLDLLNYIRDFLEESYPGCDLSQLNSDELIFDIKLSDEARFDFEKFLITHKFMTKTRLGEPLRKSVRCHFKNQVQSEKSSNIEQINQFHPLTRFVSERVQKNIEAAKIVYFPSVSLNINHSEVPGIKPQDYLFYVERWSVKGVKEIERLVYFAKPIQNIRELLSDDDSEKLVTCASKVGTDWYSAANELDIPGIVPQIEECMNISEQRYLKYILSLEHENNDRADLQEKTLNLHMERQCEKLQDVLYRHEEKGNIKMIAPVQGQIEKIKSRIKDKIRQVNERRDLKHYSVEVSLGLIRVK